ncbi:nrm [Drosophila busckii]|uniref:Nrm n=1 Tax=Drosophila busckii TaxID=30019 RepID=A0A0M4EB46_DROBS|nr:nrm [Drosophila busckii]
MLLRRLPHSGGSKPTLNGFTTTTTTTTWLLLCLAFVTHVSAQIDHSISEHENKNVVLPCPVNEQKCGKLHSLNWFKGDDRIVAMLLDDSNATSVNEEFKNRVTVEQNPYRLVIKDLKISDEDIYLCDTTFFIPEETCDNFNGYRVELRVLDSPTHDLQDGLYTSTLELDWALSREDLAKDIECRVESAAIKSPIVNKFSVDLQVRPTRITITGVEHHTVQGSKVVLTCDIFDARPAVNLTWYNATALISPEENDLTEIRTRAYEKSDGTFHTQSELIFNATRFENDRLFRCEAENIVLQINREKPIAADLTLEVLYPPVVKVSPPEMVTNTSEIVLLNCEYVANPASLTQVVWYRNGDIVNVNDTQRYQGGNSENVALVIQSTDKEDIGNYSCQLANAIGKGVSEQQIDLDVQYKPIVEVQMIPEGPVKESDESNVTLFCNILDANPAVLTKVRWYANSTLLKELPDCEETRDDLCHIDPSKLLLESIGRGFFYNYSCEGFNAAGWGPRSKDKELMVHYEPGPATLVHFPDVGVKKKSVSLTCSVEDPGYPESNRTQIAYHTVQALQPHEADAAFEALLLQKQQELQQQQQQQRQLELNPTPTPAHISSSITSLTSMVASRAQHAQARHEIKETHALIDLHLNHSLCTLLTLTTYMPQSQILTLYTGGQPFDSSDSTATYALYRKMGKFMYSAQTLSQPIRYRWLRGGRGPLPDIVTKEYTVEPLGLDSRTNYSCYAYNEGGKGQMATINLDVHAPPFFIRNMQPYTGVLHSTSNFNLTCRIECVPRCEISWQKDGVPIEKNDTRYFVKERYMDASPATGDFESMLSVLHFNLSNFPNKKFDIATDNAKYMCISTPNAAGPTVNSTTYLSIEYAPDDITVSETLVHVEEHNQPGRVICKSQANPAPQYEWILPNHTVILGNTLSINDPIKRNETGIYKCRAFNKHGDRTADTMIDVHFKPRCEIERLEIDDQDTLICTAFGNPVEADFAWSIKAENETVEALGSGDKKNYAHKSFYTLQEDYAIARTYRCMANNTVGQGAVCELEVAEQLAWWQRWDKTTFFIILAIILILLLAVIIICCIIICICRRRRRQDKLLPQVGVALPIQDTTTAAATLLPATLLPQQKPTAAAAAAAAAAENNNEPATPTPTTRNGATLHATVPKSPPRWPLRPGVMLHVSSDTKENLAVNRMTLKPHANPNASQLSAQLNDSQTNSNSTMLTEVTVTDTATPTAAAAAAVATRSQLATNPIANPNLPSTDASEANTAAAAAELTSCLDSPIPATAATVTPATAAPSSMQRILAFVFRRAKRANEQDDGTRDSQRSHVGLLQTFWRGRGQQLESPFAAQHRLKGIRSSGSVTYKKTQSAINTTTTTGAAPIMCSSHSNAPSPASVTFQAPSLDKTPATAAATAATSGAAATTAHAGPGASCLQLPRGILKCPTPPPRPPAPNLQLRRGLGLNSSNSSEQQPPLLKRSVLVAPSKIERVQMVERVPPPPPAPSSALLNTNPFLAASNFKKYDAAGEELLGSMQRSKRGKAGSLLERMDIDKKFYSLKFPNGNGNKLKKPAYNLNASLGVPATATATATQKCKRHHSFAGGSHGDIDNLAGKPMRPYDPPVYENVADKCGADYELDMGNDGSSSSASNQHPHSHLNHNLATVQLHTQPTAAATAAAAAAAAVVVSGGHKKKHHHRQHQQKADASAAVAGADFQLMEPERLSIYRSDSGISNSSYESQLPTAAQLGQRTPKAHKNAAPGLNLQRKPVYMNMEQQQSSTSAAAAARAGSPAHNIHSSYESGSSAPITDPTSLSSSNSLYSSGTGTVSTRCNRHQQQQQQQPKPEITTPEDYEQYQLGHQPAHSASMLSVASSVSAASRGKCKPSPTIAAQQQQHQQQQQQQLQLRLGTHEPTQLPAPNPFLALKRNNNGDGNVGSGSSGSGSVACSKKLRRQTISDPCAHIKRHYADDANATNANSNRSTEASAAHGDSAKSTPATSTAAAAAATEQQTSGSNGHGLEFGNGRGGWSGNHQQQMLMPNELRLQANTRLDCNQNLRYVPPMPPQPQPRPLDSSAGAYDCLVSTQTANGKLQQLRQQLQEQQLERQQQQQQQQPGPLIYRPLALSEQHAFKPISPTPATATEYEKREQQQQQQQQQQQTAATSQLNPAASLEALELLTKTHPDFMFTRNSSSAANATNVAATAAPDEEEDLGYSFCEEEYMVDDDDDEEEEQEQPPTAPTAPPTTPAHSAAVANATAGALRYFMTQSYREVHI